jgi:hypothetical protein
VPVQLRLARRIALFSGRPYSWAVGDDVSRIDLNGSNVFATFGLPMGLLVQPIEAFALQLRTGVFRVKGGGNFEATLVPLAMDAIVSVPVADVGITVALPGDVHAYAQVRTITVWGQLRL